MSYKETFVDQVNYGENCGLIVDKIVFRDTVSGKQLQVNTEKQRSYEQLNEEERHRVKITSCWKDHHRVSNKGKSTLSHVGTLPAASHVKQYEKTLNAQLGEIHPVCCCCCCYFH